MPDITTADGYVPKETWQSLVKDRATEDEIFERIGRIGYWTDRYPAVTGFSACVNRRKSGVAIPLLPIMGGDGRPVFIEWKCQILVIRFDSDHRVSSVSETVIDHAPPGNAEFFKWIDEGEPKEGPRPGPRGSNWSVPKGY
jgi:hypothetical protein